MTGLGEARVVVGNSGLGKDVDGEGGCIGIGLGRLLLAVRTLPVLISQFGQHPGSILLLGGKEFLLPLLHPLPVGEVIAIARNPQEHAFLVERNGRMLTEEFLQAAVSLHRCRRFQVFVPGRHPHGKGNEGHAEVII